jgi:hypothetical protein
MGLKRGGPTAAAFACLATFGLPVPAFTAALPRYDHSSSSSKETICAGAHIARGHADGESLTHVNILRTIEAIYALPKAGAQQPNALRAGIADDAVAVGAFEAVN